MALETIEVARNKAPKVKAGVLSGLPEGLIAGAGFGSVFGPVGALIGAGVGILAKRLHTSELEAAARDTDTVHQLNKGIAEQLDRAAQLVPDLDRVDQERLQNIEAQRRQLSILADDSDAATRVKARRDLAALSTDGFLKDMQVRSDAAAKEQNALRQKVGDRYHSEITQAQGVIDRENADADAVIGALNKFGYKSQVTQNLFTKYMGAQAQEEGGIPILNKFTGKPDGTPYTLDEIQQGVALKRDAVKQSYQGRQAELVKSAQRDGFGVNLEDGELSVNDLNIVPTTGGMSADAVQAAQGAAEGDIRKEAREGKGLGALLGKVPIVGEAADAILEGIGAHGETKAGRMEAAEQAIQQGRELAEQDRAFIEEQQQQRGKRSRVNP